MLAGSSCIINCAFACISGKMTIVKSRCLLKPANFILLMYCFSFLMITWILDFFQRLNTSQIDNTKLASVGLTVCKMHEGTKLVRMACHRYRTNARNWHRYSLTGNWKNRSLGSGFSMLSKASGHYSVKKQLLIVFRLLDKFP